MPLFDMLGREYQPGQIVAYSIVRYQAADTQLHVVRSINESKRTISTNTISRGRSLDDDPNAPFYPSSRKSTMFDPARGVILPDDFINFRDEDDPERYKF